MTTWIDALPVLGPLFQDPSFKWWVLCCYVAIGPVPHETTLPPVSGSTDRVTITRWKWGGMMRAIVVAAFGHAKLADRVGSLEDGVERLARQFGALVAFLEGERGASLQKHVETVSIAPPSNVSADDIPPTVSRRGQHVSRPQ